MIYPKEHLLKNSMFFACYFLSIVKPTNTKSYKKISTQKKVSFMWISYTHKTVYKSCISLYK